MFQTTNQYTYTHTISISSHMNAIAVLNHGLCVVFNIGRMQNNGGEYSE